MFRLPSISQDDIFFKATLMRNRREKLMQIDNKFIGKLTRHLEEVDSFDLNIPKFITKNNEQKINPLYLKIIPRQQIVVESFNKKGELIKKERFIICEKSRNKSKNKSDKSFKCYAFENTLKDKRCVLDNKVLQLKSDEVLIADGFLDIFSKDTGWGINYVDPKSKVESISAIDAVSVNLFKNFTNNKVLENSLIFERDCSTNVGSDKPVYLSINYSNLKTYDEKGILLKTENINNPLSEPLYTNIKKVQAYHISQPNNRYGIKYIFTLVNNDKTEVISTFTNIINKKIIVDDISLVWETGEIVTKDHVKIINTGSIDDNWFNVIDDIIKQFNSIPVFDSYNKTISVIHKDNIGKNAPYILSYDSNMISTNITENSEYPNALKVVGKDGLSIASTNIYGGDIIYNMDYYIKNDIMSDELQAHWVRYVALLELKQNEWQTLYNQRFALNQRKIKLDSEINALTLRIKYNKNLLNGYISAGDKTNQSRVKAEIDAQTATLNNYLATIKDYQTQLQALDDDMKAISSEIQRVNATDSKGKVFDDIDLEELRDIETIATYSDDYYSTPNALINESFNKLAEMLVPQIDMKVDIKNLVQLIRGDFTSIFTLGDLFKIEDEELLKELNDGDKIRLIGFEFEPKLNKISNAIFSNKTKKYDVKRNLSSIGKQVSSGTSSINTWKNVWEDSIISSNFVDSLLKNGLDLSATMARSGNMTNFITIDECGILLESQEDRNKCMLISSGLICISEDGFKSSRTAITPQAILADILAGEMIFGKKLVATSDTGVFEITGDGLTIYDENKKVRVKLGLFDIQGTTKAGLTLYDKDGNEVVISQDGILNTNQIVIPDNLDSTHPMIIPFASDDGVSYYKKVILKGYNTRYRAFESGATSGGSIYTSSSGGATTSSSGGGGTSSSGGGGTSSYNGGININVECSNPTWAYNSPTTSIATYPDDYYTNGDKSYHSHNITTGQIRHTHSVYVAEDSHAHTIGNHTHTIGNHTHTIGNHTHDLDTTHSHDLIYNIYESTICSNMSVYVDDVLVQSGINGGEFEVDITRYITKGRMNIIKITTSTNGRIVANIRVKEFIKW